MVFVLMKDAQTKDIPYIIVIVLNIVDLLLEGRNIIVIGTIKMHSEIDLLLECTCIVLERIEGVVFIPSVGEDRICEKHGKTEIKKVGYPYWVNDESDEPITRVAGRYINK